LFVFGLWRTQQIGQTDLLCASCGKGGIFLFLFRPPVHSCCHCTSDSLLDFRLKNSLDQKHKSDTGQLIRVGIIRIADNQRSVTELQDGCLNSIGLRYRSTNLTEQRNMFQCLDTKNKSSLCACYEGMWRNGGTAPLILNLGAKRRLKNIFTPPASVTPPPPFSEKEPPFIRWTGYWMVLRVSCSFLISALSGG
jgi:hypothetical protein